MDFVNSSTKPFFYAAEKALPYEKAAEKIDYLTRFLKQLYRAQTPLKLSKAQRELISTLAPKDFAFAMQKLLVSELSCVELMQLYAGCAGILPDQVARLKGSLPANHIVRTILCEHEMLLYFLADLEDVVRTIRPLAVLSNASSEFRRLTHIAAHLTVTDLHNEREDEIIFPELARHRCAALVVALRAEHSYICGAVKSLDDLIKTFGETDLVEFRKRLRRTAKCIVSAMRKHIFKEDHILYPIAVDMINDRRIWDRIKAVSDEIGYCCFECDW